MRTRLGLRTLLLLLLLGFAAASRAELVVIVHPACGTTRLSRQEVVNLFMGGYRQLPSGQMARPAELTAAHPERAQFYRALLGKELAEVRAYWARLIFSGQTLPPRELPDVEAVLAYVAANPGAVAYLERSQVDGRGRIVYEVSP